jgi:predicted HTH transcriptional regulator
MHEQKLQELLKTKDDGYLYHRESRDLEFKEQFNFAGLAEYFKDFAAFANSVGGYLIFGIKDSPRKLIGMSDSSIDQFSRVKSELITGDLNDIFSSEINWEQMDLQIGDQLFGAFYIYESNKKPIIAVKNKGKTDDDDNHIIKDGEIYYRYSGRTETIKSAELQHIINERIEANNLHWQSLMSKIGKIGPSNAVILDTKEGLIESSDNKTLLIDEELIEKISFIKEGQFKESGEKALKLVGDVVPTSAVEITKYKQKKLTELYPLSANELADAVSAKRKDIKRNDVWAIISENGIKTNSEYSAYNFPNKKHEDRYKDSGEISSTTPSLYKRKAIDHIIHLFDNKK